MNDYNDYSRQREEAFDLGFQKYGPSQTRARGTDLARLRPASASVRFLEILTGPLSLRRTERVRPLSASVLFGRYFIGPWSASVFEADVCEEKLPSCVLHRLRPRTAVPVPPPLIGMLGIRISAYVIILYSIRVWSKPIFTLQIASRANSDQLI